MEILQFSLLACLLFYAIICIFAFLRFIRLYKGRSRVTSISLFLYFSMIIAAFTRGISLYLISTHLESNKKSNLETLIYVMIIFPDLLNICLYIILIWYYLASFLIAHVSLANDTMLFLKHGKTKNFNLFIIYLLILDNPTIKFKTYLILYIFLFGYLITFVILCILNVFQIIKKESLFLIDSIFNLASPIIFITYYMYVVCKYSGRPYINPTLKDQVKRIFIIVISWSITRIVK